MKSSIVKLLGLVALFFLSCEEELIDNPESYSKVYMPQAVELPAEHPLVMTDTLQTIIFGGAYGGVDNQPQNIQIRFEVDPSLVDVYNSEHETNYPIMPEGSYDIETTEAAIPPGKYNSEPLQLKVRTIGGLTPLTTYLLPVTIAEVTPDINVNEELRTTYFLIESEYEYFDRSEWSVVEVSSEEPPAVGSEVLDGDPSTSWHTAWRGGSPPHPHFLTMDMKEVKSLHGFYFWPHTTARTGNPTDINIEVSMDGENWEELGNFEISSDFAEQRVYLDETKEARFFKVIVNASSNNTPHTHPTEIGAF